ncbi:MAG: extracellular solute-binding protein [Halapricum sp.]
MAGLAATGTSAVGAGCGELGTTSGDGTESDTLGVFVEAGFPADTVKTALYEHGGLSRDVDVMFRIDDDYEAEPTMNDFVGELEKSSDAADLLVIRDSWLQQFHRGGLLANLTERLPERVLTPIESECFWAASRSGRAQGTGDRYGIPLRVETRVILYRRDLAEAAGYDPAGANWGNEPLSWERWSHVVADTLANSGVKYGFTSPLGAYRSLVYGPFYEALSTWGGAYFGDPTTTLLGPAGERPVTVAEDAGMDAVRMLRRFLHGESGDGFGSFAGDVVPAAALEWNVGDVRKALSRDAAVAHHVWTSALTDSAVEDVDVTADRFGVTPTPYGVRPEDGSYPRTGGTMSPMVSRQVIVNPNTERQSAVTRVLQAMTSPGFQQHLLRTEGWLPPRKDVFDSAAANETLGAHAKTLRLVGEHALPGPYTPVWPDQIRPIATHVNAVLSREQSPQAGLESLASELQRIEQNA